LVGLFRWAGEGEVKAARDHRFSQASRVRKRPGKRGDPSAENLIYSLKRAKFTALSSP